MWNKVSEKELPYGEEVIAFNEKWIDEDRNPSGSRKTFVQAWCMLIQGSVSLHSISIK